MENKKFRNGLIIFLVVMAIVGGIFIWRTNNAVQPGPQMFTQGTSVTMVDDSTYHINLTDSACLTLQKSQDTLIAYPVGHSFCYANPHNSDTVFVIITNPPVPGVTEYSFHISYHDYFPDDNLKYFKKVDADHDKKVAEQLHDDSLTALKIAQRVEIQKYIMAAEAQKDSIEKLKNTSIEEAKLEGEALKEYATDYVLDNTELVQHGSNVFVIRVTPYITVSLMSKGDTLYVASVGSKAYAFQGSPLIVILRYKTDEYYCIDYMDYFDEYFPNIVINRDI